MVVQISVSAQYSNDTIIMLLPVFEQVLLHVRKRKATGWLYAK